MSNAVVLEKILSEKSIRAVYQPIVSLKNGTVFAYEALSRISDSSLNMDIEGMFSAADKIGCAWELEGLCRVKSLEGFVGAPEWKKLFLNVSPNIINDEKFKEGFTKFQLSKYNILAEHIVFEITERVSSSDNKLFRESIAHYRNQDYNIAIDDVGSGYSGLNTIVDIKPNYIKLDMHLIRNLDMDHTKLLLCKSLVDFCKDSGIKIIAEGIESEEELCALIKLGVDFGQGFFLAVPNSEFAEISAEKVQLIEKYYSKHYIEKSKSSIFPTIEHLCRRGCTFSPDDKVESIFDTLRQNPAIMEFSVLEGDRAIGFMTRSELNATLGGRYGYSLNARKPIRQLLRQEFLCVNSAMTADQVSRLAMQRPYEQLYNPIVVECGNKFYGIVTIKALLDTCTKIELDAALHSNPLTGLPGNLLIEKEITQRIFGDRPYCITYYDLDNFKAYNDGYGFENGDLMLKLVAEILRQCATRDEFIGHIGGDDFIVAADYAEGEEYCRSVISRFEKEVLSLYRDEDLRRGYIISKNRSGITEKFPVAGISIGGVTSRGKRYHDLDDFSRDVAFLKKSSKKQKGSSFILL